MQMRDGTHIRHPETGQTLIYEGSSTLHKWIERADEKKGREKTCVDELIACNSSIIDIEMGLPASGDRKTAQRMDCVALEREGDRIHIVFWEAKMIDDADCVQRAFQRFPSTRYIPQIPSVMSHK